MINLRHIANASNAQQAGFEGKWHAIDFQPDLTVPQRFVIGVALSQKGKLTHFRIANEAPKLKCFYAQRFSKEVWEWLQAQLSTELKQHEGSAVGQFASASPQITLGTGFYASASDANTALSRAFQRIVTVVGTEKRVNNRGLGQLDLRAQVGDLLKTTMKARYSEIAQPHGIQLLNDGLVSTFDIGFDDKVTAASVVSASYVSLDTAKINVITAINDLYMFLKIRKREQIGIAVLTPTTALLPPEAVNMWKIWWKNESEKLKDSELVLLAESDSPEQLASDVADWFPEPEPTPAGLPAPTPATP